MGLEKSIKSGKEHREEYKYKKNYCKSVSSSCRNHGTCPWCEGNRTNKNKSANKQAVREIRLGEVVSVEELDSYLPNNEYEAYAMDMYFDD